MKNFNCCETGFVILRQNEMMHYYAGADGIALFSFTLTGVLDGVKHNTECHLTLFGKKIF